mmetsp:Transcript_3307/g.7953  ORF Transcript_3307/g.7953 Transcript_3307/m.7953 type:complete len:414 (-) Transcript_3307:1716-2957(-)
MLLLCGVHIHSARSEQLAGPSLVEIVHRHAIVLPRSVLQDHLALRATGAQAIVSLSFCQHLVPETARPHLGPALRGGPVPPRGVPHAADLVVARSICCVYLTSRLSLMVVALTYQSLAPLVATVLFGIEIRVLHVENVGVTCSAPASAERSGFEHTTELVRCVHQQVVVVVCLPRRQHVPGLCGHPIIGVRVVVHHGRPGVTIAIKVVHPQRHLLDVHLVVAAGPHRERSPHVVSSGGVVVDQVREAVQVTRGRRVGGVEIASRVDAMHVHGSALRYSCAPLLALLARSAQRVAVRVPERPVPSLADGIVVGAVRALSDAPVCLDLRGQRINIHIVVRGKHAVHRDVASLLRACDPRGRTQVPVPPHVIVQATLRPLALAEHHIRIPLARLPISQIRIRRIARCLRLVSSALG